ncbi:MAG: serine hydrolase domain-containing protein [Bacteroidota bacterium]
MKQLTYVLTLSSFLLLIHRSDAQESIAVFERSIVVDGKNYTLAERMEHYGVAGVSIAVVRDGALSWARGYGYLQKGKPEKVNTETVFSVGSISKVGTAATILHLVDRGDLDLDADVNTYLSQWKVPENKYTKNQSVTLRHIMSHTAGLTVHGFADFLPDEKLPNTVEILKGTSPAKNSPVLVNIPIGSQFRYSGGGTQVLQLIIEEMRNAEFPQATQALLFEPLNMNRSTYENPLPEAHGNIAKAHDRRGKPVALPRGYQAMPEMAASGLWTTPSDLTKLIIALMESYHSRGGFLSQSTTKDMMTKVLPSDYGLGPELEGAGSSKSFSHGGANDSYRAFFRGYLETKNGFVILTNGNRGSELIREIHPALIKAEGF